MRVLQREMVKGEHVGPDSDNIDYFFIGVFADTDVRLYTMVRRPPLCRSHKCTHRTPRAPCAR